MLTKLGLRIVHHRMLHMMAERTNFYLVFELDQVFLEFRVVSLLCELEKGKQLEIFFYHIVRRKVNIMGGKNDELNKKSKCFLSSYRITNYCQFDLRYNFDRSETIDKKSLHERLKLQKKRGETKYLVIKITTDSVPSEMF